MRQRVYRIGGDLELPLVGVSINDLTFIAVPFMLSYRFASETHPVLGLFVAVFVALLARTLLFACKARFPGKTLAQTLRWYSQADHYRPHRDIRTQTLVRKY